MANRDNPALLKIKVTDTHPEMAVQIANTWASECIEMFNQLSTGTVTKLGLIRERLRLAESGLERAGQALRTFEQETGLGIALNQEHGLTLGSEAQDPYAWYGTLRNELEAKSELLANHRVTQDNLLLLLDVAQEARETGGGIDDLPLHLLGVQAFADRRQLSAELIIQEAEDLNALMELLQAEEQSLASVIDVLSSEVEELRAELMEDKYEYLLVNRTRDALLERIDMLSRKAQELEAQSSGVRITNPAVGVAAVGSSPWLNVAVAGVLGLFAGITMAFSLEYVRGLHASNAPQW